MSLTRLKSVCVSLWKDYAASPKNLMIGRKNWNNVFSPACLFIQQANGIGDSINVFSPDGAFEFHMQIGSKLGPEYPIKFHAEEYYQLRFKNTLGHQSSAVNDLPITASEYKSSNCSWN